MSRTFPLIGVDGSRLSPRQSTGTENYSREIARHLLDLDLPVRWRLYLNEPVSSDTDRYWSQMVDTRPIAAARVWTHGRLSMEMIRHRPDLLFVPSHVVPIVHPRSVVTIHDLGYLWYPEMHPAGQRRMLDLSTRWSAHAARHIIVPSATTKADLIRAYGIDGQKITVIHHGVSARFGSIAPSMVRELRSKLHLHGPYVLSVGTIQPRKNFEILGEAMVMLRDRGIDCTLIIAGRPGWLADRVLDRLHEFGLGERLRIIDYISDDDLPALYAGASCYVQPSLFEGFGLPVIEAMSSAVPVLVSSASCLPEIAGDGADVFNPDDAGHLCSSLQDIVLSAERSMAMAARALARSTHFSWNRAAEQTARVLLDQL
ncbi:MAG: glycosyltransferase family 4 protein, partial [Chloroflexota bacterium]|nr:glycosyltransferase family 4 protein [Chloroflexota bacterium]